MTVSIVIADDHGVLRAGLRSLLSAEADLRVVGEAPDGDAALDTTQTLKPDVLLADISMPGPSGIELARMLRDRAAPTAVLILTMHEDRGLVKEALEAGARGYLPKRVAEAELVNAVRVVAGGGIYVPADCMPQGGDAAQVEPLGTFVELRPIELDFLRLTVQGRTNAQIGQELNLPVAAVAEMRNELAQKLGLGSRAAFVRYAHQHRLM